jgi:tRNA threonylcarbamoyladenosine biosynthesis protein TsaB
LITVAIDTSEARGSIALLRHGEPVAVAVHADRTDYSEWLLPATEQIFQGAGTRIGLADLFAVATGPGSFTGVRVGLTTVKAWCEVYGKPVVGVSRLEALARSETGTAGMVAAFYDAHRGQIFGGLYRRSSGRLVKTGDELVTAPEAFLALATREAGDRGVHWVSLDPELMTSLEGWKEREERGDRMQRSSAELAVGIGRIAEERAARGEYTDALELDANYVRRSDAEIFWKGPAAHAR